MLYLLKRNIFAKIEILILIFRITEYTNADEDALNYDKLQYPAIKNCGYPHQVHYVVTSDGYILTIFRVHKVENVYQNAVLFVPGLACTASVWVNFGPENSLPCVLADNGYDAWLVNYRGNTWSRNHTTLDPDVDKNQFWNYTLHEVGYYDIPAVIDYVLSATNQTSVHYIGHSIAAPIFLIMAADRNYYAKKVKLAVLLAPAAYMGDAVNPLIHLINQSRSFINTVTKDHDVYELCTHTEGLISVLQILCCKESPLQNLCVFGLLSLMGFTPKQVNTTLFPLIFTNFPGGISVDILYHSMQLISNKLEKFDYGANENLKRYGNFSPPAYDLSKVSTPIVLYYGDKDYIVNAKNVDLLSKNLPNVIGKKLLMGFNHLDVIFGKDSKIVFQNILRTLNKFK